jgi:hypothetical protein
LLILQAYGTAICALVLVYSVREIIDHGYLLRHSDINSLVKTIQRIRGGMPKDMQKIIDYLSLACRIEASIRIFLFSIFFPVFISHLIFQSLFDIWTAFPSIVKKRK